MIYTLALLIEDNSDRPFDVSAKIAAAVRDAGFRVLGYQHMANGGYVSVDQKVTDAHD